jgi:hypothetical protein
MAEPPPDLDDDTGTPRWVYVSGAIAIVLVLLFVILHLAGGGFKGHTPGSHTPPSSDTARGAEQPRP